VYCPRPAARSFAVDNSIFEQLSYCMEKEPAFTEVQSLELIQSMINKAKNRFTENGHLYLLWGWAVLICSITQFILIHFVHYERHYLVWTLTWLVVIYQMIYLYRREKKAKVKTYTDDIIGFIWMTFVVLMFLFGFLFGNVMGDEYYKFINPGFLALYGMPTFLSGVILRFRPLRIGGICCWALSVATTFVPYDYQILMLGLGVAVAWILPGYILKARYKKENA
jgi:hypothetical protein